jgi:hypothetical protein
MLASNIYAANGESKRRAADVFNAARWDAGPDDSTFGPVESLHYSFIQNKYGSTLNTGAGETSLEAELELSAA